MQLERRPSALRLRIRMLVFMVIYFLLNGVRFSQRLQISGLRPDSPWGETRRKLGPIEADQIAHEGIVSQTLLLPGINSAISGL